MHDFQPSYQNSLYVNFLIGGEINTYLAQCCENSSIFVSQIEHFPRASTILALGTDKSLPLELTLE